jgi:sugar (pentulose or hexulose) kinase
MTKPAFVLSVDIGTSALKAAFIDLKGRLLSFARAAYVPEKGGAVLASDWERAFTLALEALRSQGGRGARAAPSAICVSGNGPTLVPVTFSGEALPPLHWHDGRTVQGAPSPSFFLPHAAWLKEKEADQYKNTALFFSSQEWLSYRLGAEPVTVLPSKDYERFYWDEEQCGLFGLDRGKFPPFVKKGGLIGTVSSGGAGPAGLIPGTPIVAGAPDFIAALIGAGAMEEGSVCDRAGTSEGINLCVSSQVEAPVPGLRVLPHAREGFWNVGALIPSSGRLFEWYRALTGQAGRDYGELLAELIPSPEDARPLSTELFFPPDAFDSPCPVSLPPAGFSVPGLSGRLQLGRAVLETMGFMARRAAEKISALGFPVQEMGVSGGQCRNRRWNSFKADITGITLHAPEIPDGELAGGAVLAAWALGEYPSLEKAASAMIRMKESFAPRKESAPLWEERYRLYLKHCEAGCSSAAAPAHTPAAGRRDA